MADIDYALRLLQNKVRRQILERLVREPHYPMQLAELIGVSQQAIKKHLKELENVDVEKELEAHKILDDWHKLDKEQRQLQKDKSNLEATIVQADKTAKKLDKDLSKLHEKATCYACGQDLPQEKIEEMQRHIKKVLKTEEEDLILSLIHI